MTSTSLAQHENGPNEHLEVLSLLHAANALGSPSPYYIIMRDLPSEIVTTDATSPNIAQQADISPPDPTLPLEQINATASGAVYFPLLPQTVRTILLHPGRSDEPIICRLVQPTVIKDQVQALSYVWGSHENPGNILLNGMIFYVTRNLEAALLRIRDTKFARELWVDALCINQFDQAERAVQVRDMHHIYSKVSCVLAWLSNDSTSIAVKLTMNLISRMEDKQEIGGWRSMIKEKVFRQKRNQQTLEELFSKELKRHKYRKVSAITLGMIELYSNEYWNRVWIVQEIALAKKVLAIAGKFPPVSLPALIALGVVLDAMSFDCMGRFSQRSYNIAIAQAGLHLSGPNTVTTIPTPDTPWSNTTTNQLNHLMRTKRCTDPRDKIFGWHNLLEPALKGEIDVDYTCEARGLLVSSLQKIITKTQRLDIITWQKPQTSQTGLTGLESSLPFPRWAPSLDVKMSDIKCELPGNFDAGHDSHDSISFLPGSEILRTKGVLLGYVHDVFDPPVAFGSISNESQRPLDVGSHSFAILNYARHYIEQVEKRYGGPMDRAKLVATVTGLMFKPQPPGSNIFLPLVTSSLEEASKMISSSPSSYLSMLEAASRLIVDRSFFDMIRIDAGAVVEKEDYRKPDMGLGVPGVKPGDVVCVLLGCRLPVVLRPEDKLFRVICDAYIHGQMHGEALNAFKDGKEELVEFLLC